MARLARVVVPRAPHHVTQRGNRRQAVFFSDDDYAAYRALLAESCRDSGTQILAYCLMPNHVHLIMLPADEAGLRASLGETHRRYSRMINARNDWRGYLWQGRFASAPMDEGHCLMAARYVELNPVRAGLVAKPRDWRWSSASAHLAGRDDALVKVAPLLELAPDWAAFLAGGLKDSERETIRQAERTGRPLGAPRFLAKLEKKLGRALVKRKPGPRPRKKSKGA